MAIEGGGRWGRWQTDKQTPYLYVLPQVMLARAFVGGIVYIRR